MWSDVCESEELSGLCRPPLTSWCFHFLPELIIPLPSLLHLLQQPITDCFINMWSASSTNGHVTLLQWRLDLVTSGESHTKVTGKLIIVLSKDNIRTIQCNRSRIILIRQSLWGCSLSWAICRWVCWLLVCACFCLDIPSLRFSGGLGITLKPLHYIVLSWHRKPRTVIYWVLVTVPGTMWEV